MENSDYQPRTRSESRDELERDSTNFLFLAAWESNPDISQRRMDKTDTLPKLTITDELAESDKQSDKRREEQSEKQGEEQKKGSQRVLPPGWEGPPPVPEYIGGPVLGRPISDKTGPGADKRTDLDGHRSGPIDGRPGQNVPVEGNPSGSGDMKQDRPPQNVPVEGNPNGSGDITKQPPENLPRSSSAFN